MSHPATDALYVLHRASKQAAAERKRADAELAKLEPRIRNMLAGHDLSTPEGIARCHNHLFDILRDKVGSEFEPQVGSFERLGTVTDRVLDECLDKMLARRQRREAAE